mmetsp:Transcript_16767/g.39299  ORF Transcript_16767/g.39299 Transcript_16767/m.39299 type:complete len:255 (+) Transcript_16767:33-797(+)
MRVSCSEDEAAPSDAKCCKVITVNEAFNSPIIIPADWIGDKHAQACCAEPYVSKEADIAQCEACMEHGGSWQESQCSLGKSCPVAGVDCCHVIMEEEREQNDLPVAWGGIEHAKACCTPSPQAASDCRACLVQGGSWQEGHCHQEATCPLKAGACCRPLTDVDLAQTGLPAVFTSLEASKRCCPASEAGLMQGRCETCLSEGKVWQLQYCHERSTCPIEHLPCCRVWTADEVKERGWPARWAGSERARVCCKDQ